MRRLNVSISYMSCSVPYWCIVGAFLYVDDSPIRPSCRPQPQAADTSPVRDADDLPHWYLWERFTIINVWEPNWVDGKPYHTGGGVSPDSRGILTNWFRDFSTHFRPSIFGLVHSAFLKVAWVINRTCFFFLRLLAGCWASSKAFQVDSIVLEVENLHRKKI